MPSDDKPAMGSFVELALTEAIARQVRVWLITAPARRGEDGRLYSRMLAAHGPDKLVLEVPRAGQRVGKGGVPAGKVLLSAGSEVGMAFSVGRTLFQARTTVAGRCQFALYPTRRVDALLVHRPEHIIAAERRQRARQPVDPSHYIPASLWPAQSLQAGDTVPPRSGRLLDSSPNGLGVRLERPLPDDPGTEMLIRLGPTATEAGRLFLGVLVHCSRDEEGLWLAGFDGVTELDPGAEAELIHSIIAPPG